MPATNKPVAIMAADVNAQTSVLRINISYYPHTLNLKPPRMQVPKRWLQVGDSEVHKIEIYII